MYYSARCWGHQDEQTQKYSLSSWIYSLVRGTDRNTRINLNVYNGMCGLVVVAGSVYQGGQEGTPRRWWLFGTMQRKKGPSLGEGGRQGAYQPQGTTCAVVLRWKGGRMSSGFLMREENWKPAVQSLVDHKRALSGLSSGGSTEWFWLEGSDLIRFGFWKVTAPAMWESVGGWPSRYRLLD